MYNQGQQVKPGTGGIPSVPAIPPQYLNQQSQPQQQPHQQVAAPRLGVSTSYGQSQGTVQSGVAQNYGQLSAPIDVPTLIATKGYNPPNFDTRPAFVRHCF
jgi:hypothetical protein